MRKYLEFSRAPFFSATAIPVLFGTALAYRNTGQIDWLLFAISMVGLIAAHAGGNLLNDYHDFQQGADAGNVHRTRFSGGSPHLDEGREEPATFLYLGIASFAVAGVCGTALAWMVDRGVGPILYMGVIGSLLAIFYTAPPMKLAYRGMGEILIGCCFGFLPVVGVYYVQTSEISMLPFVASIPLSLWITNIIWVNEFPDFEPDKKAGKNNLVVKLGLGTSRYVYHVLAISAFLLTAFFCLQSIYGLWSLSALLLFPVNIVAAMVLHKNFETPEKLVPAQGLTILIHLFAGVLISAGLVF